MKRDYASGEDTQIEFFTGYEVEHTPAYKMHTLFVTGLHSIEDIIKKSETCASKIEHYYLGANQSFAPSSSDEHYEWDQMVCDVIAYSDCLVTLDFDVKYAQDILEYRAVEFRKFIPQISVKIPYLNQFNYNATVKIDDVDFKATNPGVWCHSLHSLTKREQFTDWDAYGKDKILK